MSRHLFLGGPWDGQDHEVDDGSWHWLVPTSMPLGVVHYTAHRVYLQPPTLQHGPSQTWLVFVTGLLPDLDRVMDLLYQLDVPPEQRWLR